MARFFLPKENIRDRRGIITGAELDHLRKVLRLGPGDRITLFDDGGWEHEAVIRSLGAAQGEIEIARSYRAERDSPLPITLALGLTKGEKMDFVVEKATELGVQAIAPLISQFTVPKFDARKIAQRTERWQKIALGAAKQCGRTRVPEICRLADFQDFVKQPRADTLKLLFWEKEQEQTLHQVRAQERQVDAVTLMIGPEGGFSAPEANAAKEQGFRTVGLGRRILRAETAAVTALALVQFIWGDLG
jgi:16S rRNA (uracil1498-N3)-methyltransferase